MKLQRVDILTALSKVNPSALRDIVVEVPSVKWTDIGGMDSVKESIRQVIGIIPKYTSYSHTNTNANTITRMALTVPSIV